MNRAALHCASDANVCVPPASAGITNLPVAFSGRAGRRAIRNSVRYSLNINPACWLPGTSFTRTPSVKRLNVWLRSGERRRWQRPPAPIRAGQPRELMSTPLSVETNAVFRHGLDAQRSNLSCRQAALAGLAALQLFPRLMTA